MIEPEKFAQYLALGKEYSLIVMETFNYLRLDTITRMDFKNKSLSEKLILPDQVKNG